MFIFWQLHLGLGRLSCSFNVSPLLHRTHDADFDINEQWLILHFPFFIKFSALVVYLAKICDLLRPQIAHLTFIKLTSFWVLGFTF